MRNRSQAPAYLFRGRRRPYRDHLRLAESAAGLSLFNAGIIRKTAGNGTSYIGPSLNVQFTGVFGSITNTGTIEADSGTLYLTPAFRRSSGTTLTGGTWDALNGSTLAV